MQHEHDGLELHRGWGRQSGSRDDAEPATTAADARFAREQGHDVADDSAEAVTWGEEQTAVHPISAAAASPLSVHVQLIVDSAERAAEHIRAEAEARARARIAEADRAADYRASAAEQEATQILADAGAEAERLINEAVLSVDTIYAEAHAQRQQAEQLLEHARQGAKESSEHTISRARNQARDIVRTAHETTDDVLAEGTEVTANLRDLSDSLRNNAERLLRDIRLAHGSMTAHLDQAMPEGAPELPSDPDTSPQPELQDRRPVIDVPEFFVPES